VNDLAPDTYILKRYRERIDVKVRTADGYRDITSEFDDK